jgi:hypothetical protein
MATTVPGEHPVLPEQGLVGADELRDEREEEHDGLGG